MAIYLRMFFIDLYAIILMKGLLIKAVIILGRNTQSYMHTIAHMYTPYFQYFLSGVLPPPKKENICKWAMLPSLPIPEMEHHFEIQHIWGITRENNCNQQNYWLHLEWLSGMYLWAKRIHISTNTQSLSTLFLLVLESISVDFMHQNHLEIF